MYIEFLVEETSAEEALRNLIPRILGTDATFDIHPFNGKTDLKNRLSMYLRGRKHYLSNDWRIVVLVDRDDEDCKTLKSELEEISLNIGLKTKSVEKDNFQVLNRIAIEELESWFFGDVEAIVTAYPKISLNIANQERYRDPDAIAGGTWEALERLLQAKGYHLSGLPKRTVARKISEHMEPNRNRSKSFQVFRDALAEMQNKL